MTASHWSVSYTLLAILLPASSLAAASKHSRRIEKLTKEAQAVSRGPINVVRIPFARGPLQGHTNGLGDVWGSQGWEVHAMAGPSREYHGNTTMQC